MDYISIGRKIFNARTKEGFTQEGLAELLDSSASYISNIERGIKKPSLCMLIKIANSLKISLDYLVSNSYSDESIRENIELRHIAEKIENLSKKNRKLYYDVSNTILDRLLDEDVE